MAPRFATRIGTIRANRFALKTSYFHDERAIRANPLSEVRFGKKRVQFWNPEMIRENQAIRANLRIDLCESEIEKPSKNL